MRDAEGSADIAAALRVLAEAVRAGGALALAKFRSPFKSWTKLHDSPVSEVDIAVNDLLRERLAAFAPEFGWLSEESVDDPARLDATHVWIVDPIDGTRAFIAGREDWVISAALARGGRPVAGAIYVPVADRLFLAAAGAGATVNGVPIAAGDAGREATLAAGPKRQIDALTASGLRVEAEPRVHSLALRLARVADASLDVAFAGGNSHDWDIAAADVIVHEAGGAVTDLTGRAVTYNRPDPVHSVLVATRRDRHAGIMRALHGQPAAR